MKKFLGKQLALLLALIFCVTLLPIAAFAEGEATTQEKVTIHLLGDSTMCKYSTDSYPTWGQGQGLDKVFNSNVTINNKAQSGASSRSTYNNANLWGAVKEDLKEGDYLFIQFGHNDSKSGSSGAGRWAPLSEIDESNSNYSYYENTYYFYMQQFIDYAKSVGAIPVIFTSIERLSDFKPEGWTDATKPVLVKETSLKGYAQVAREIAAENNLVCVDMYKMSTDYILSLDTLGEANTLYMCFAPGVWPNYTEGKTDNTHLTEKGATTYATLAVNYLASIEHPLGNYIRTEDDPEEEEETPAVSYLIEGFGDYTASSIGTVGDVEYTLVDEIEGKFSYYPNKNTGIDVEGAVAPAWYTKIHNGRLGMSQTAKTFADEGVTFFSRKFDTTMDADNTVFRVSLTQLQPDFGKTQGIGTTRVILNNTNGEDLVTFDIFKTSTGSKANVCLQNVPAADGTHTRTLTPFTTKTDAIYKRDKETVLSIYPDFTNKTFSVVATDADSNPWDLLAVDVPMSIPESGVYNFDEVLLGGTGGFTVLFDNLVATSMSKDEKAEFTERKEEEMANQQFVDTFEWGTPVAEGEEEGENNYTTHVREAYTVNGFTTAVNGITKVGSSITSAPVAKNGNASYHIKDVGGIIDVTIENGDGDHGQVLQYKRTNPEGYSEKYNSNRGIYLNAPAAFRSLTPYTSVEFDYKPLTAGSLAQYLETYDSANGDQGGWQNSIGTAAYSTQGSYATASSNVKRQGYAAYANYLPKEMLDESGNLKTGEWYNIKYVFDFGTFTYDLYINGYLIAAGCPRLAPDIAYDGTVSSIAGEGYSFRRVLIGAASGNEFTCQIDNFKAQGITEQAAAQALVEGFEKNIGDGVIRADERKEVASGKQGLVLPYQGTFGFNGVDNGAYKIADATGVIAEKRDKAPLNYTLPAEYVVDANGNVSGVTAFTESKRSLAFYNNICLHTTNATLEEGQKADVLGMLAPTVTTVGSVPGAQSGIGMAHFRGDKSDVKFDMTVTFTKGNTKINKDYSLLFKRNLMESKVDNIEIGVPAFSGISNGKVTADKYAQFNTYVKSSGSEDTIIFAVMVGYDADNNIVFSEGTAETVMSGADATRLSIQLGKNEGFVYNTETGEWDNVGKASEYEVGHIDHYYPGLGDAVTKVKVFLWNAEGFAPLAETIVSEAPVEAE